MRAGLGQQWAGPKLARFFQAKNFNIPARPKNWAGRAKLFFQGKKKFGRAGPGQIWPDFFQANNLMAQPSSNFGRTGLAHRVGPILPPLGVSNCKCF